MLRSVGLEGQRDNVLLTDGLANVGVVDPGSLTAMTRKAAEASNVGTTTIGFGEGFDEELLAAMADAGGGNRTMRIPSKPHRRSSRRSSRRSFRSSPRT